LRKLQKHLNAIKIFKNRLFSPGANEYPNCKGCESMEQRLLIPCVCVKSVDSILKFSAKTVPNGEITITGIKFYLIFKVFLFISS